MTDLLDERIDQHQVWIVRGGGRGTARDYVGQLQYQGIADTIVQLCRGGASVLIAVLESNCEPPSENKWGAESGNYGSQ